MKTTTNLIVSLTLCLAMSSMAGCKKKSGPDCEALFEHTVSLMPAEMQAQVKSGKDKAIAKCEKLSPEARQCVLDAKSMQDLMKCPHK